MIDRPWLVLQYARAELGGVAEDLAQLESLRLDLALYFCEDASTFKLDDCLKVISTFCDLFCKACQVRNSGFELSVEVLRFDWYSSDCSACRALSSRVQLSAAAC